MSAVPRRFRGWAAGSMYEQKTVLPRPAAETAEE